MRTPSGLRVTWMPRSLRARQVPRGSASWTSVSPERCAPRGSGTIPRLRAALLLLPLLALGSACRGSGSGSGLSYAQVQSVHPGLTADQVTDALRAAALRVRGYRAEVVEFVALEHTARNLMIRAVAGGPVGDSAAVAEYEALKQFWGVTPYIERALAAEVSGGLVSRS